jgi:hypothetical protein
MSPLLGAIGDSSEYSYRGNLDDLPNDFSFTNVSNAEPGIAYTTGPVTISGINNKILVSVSAGSSIAVSSGIFTSGPVYVRNNQTISIRIPTTKGTDADFSKSYFSRVKVGKLNKDWVVTTRNKDLTPDPFTFTSFSNQELGVVRTSNTITITGIETSVPTNASITSGIGSFSKNGGPTGVAATVGNGDTIAITLSGPTNYSEVNNTTFTVGTYTASFSVSTRASDTTVDQFSFPNYVNVGLSSSFDSVPIVLSGADTNTFTAPVPLTATVSGGFLKVVRASSIVRDFNANPTTVYNGDVLTLRLNSSPSYSTNTSAILTITGANTPVGVTSTFRLTTRPIISDTIPNQFQFVDKSGQGRNISTISDPITISGITTHANDFASAFLTNNNDGGQFRITRGGVVVRDFSADPAQIRNGDVINLKITTSPASNGSVLTRFNVSGTDNTDINNIVSQTINDTWIVQSAVRNCTLVAPTFTNVSDADPASLKSVTFTPVSYDSDCGVVVNTSNTSSYLNVNGTIGNNLTVLPGVACTVFMTAPDFSTTRTTTVTLTANNNIPSPITTSSNWSISSRSTNDPTATITANPSTISCNESSTLTWFTTKAASITTNGFTGVTTSGSLSVGPLKQTTTFSITARSTDNTTATSSITVLVNSTADVQLNASSTSIAYNGSVTLSWSSSNASSVVSNFGVSATSGSITLNNLKSTTTYTIRAVSNSGCADSATKSVTVNVASCTKTTNVENVAAGVSINYTLSNAGQGYAYYYTGVSGYGLSSESRRSLNTTGAQTYDGNSVPSKTETYFTVPNNVYSIYCACNGAGGGGGGGGDPRLGGGGGGGGRAFGTILTSPGRVYKVIYGPGGAGAPGGAGGRTPNLSGGTGSFGITGQGSVIQIQNPDGTWSDLLRGRGGYGGGRDLGGTGGGGTPSSWQTYNGPNINNTGNGGVNNGSDGSVTAAGSLYRSGGSGGGKNANGANGIGGWISISWTQSIEGASWSDLISRIAQQYKNSFNRPPTSQEMNYWIEVYVNYSYNTVTEIQSAIAGSGAFYSSTGAIDECGTRV